jgi:diaminopimelate epimerase
VNIPFWKMHGAGNDFVLVDDRAGGFPCADRVWMQAVAARRTGVGCEGIILIQSSTRAHIRMRFFNPDGNEVEMCGNGARCVARLASEIGAAPQRVQIETTAGVLSAAVMNDGVRLEMTDPIDWRLDRVLRLPDGEWPYAFVNTGVPHVVIRVEDLDACDVAARGPPIRYHDDFAPAGTNVNFMQATGPRELRVRTYERGVEAETLACGTGIVAAALVAARLGAVTPPVSVVPAGGDTLTVDFTLTASGAESVSLTGPAVHVFRGNLEYRPSR